MHDIFKLFLFRTDRGERCVNLVPRLFSALPPVHEVGKVFGPTAEKILLAVGIGWLIDHSSRKGVGEMKGKL